jgi:hypothetical protein
MKRSRFSGEQIAYALRQTESGTAVADLALDKHMLSEALRKRA